MYESEAAAARAVDRAQIQRRGIEAITNFPLVDYVDMLGECSFPGLFAVHAGCV